MRRVQATLGLKAGESSHCLRTHPDTRKLLLMTTTVEAIYENGKLTLTQALPLPERTPVTVTIKTGEPGSDAERAAWLKLSEIGLARAYGDDEPEYNVGDVKNS